MQRLCLVNPPASIAEAEYFFPMSLVALAGSLKGTRVAVQIIDLDYLIRRDETSWKIGKFLDIALERIAPQPGDTIGITSICSNFPLALLLARALRKAEPKCKIIMGGPQPSAVAEETLEAFPEIDLVVIGEGEETIRQLAATDLSPPALGDIHGIVYRTENGTVRRNGKRPLASCMDELPFPDFSLLPMDEYQKFAAERDIRFNGQVEVGRGCPFHCTFCSTSIMWERRFRVKSPARIFEEIKALHSQYGFTAFELIHDNFTTSRKFVRDFCEYFREHNDSGFIWSTSSRTDCIDEDRIMALLEAGCRGLFFGIETASARMQKIIGKNLDLARFDGLVRFACDRGMPVTTAFIAGFPEEAEEDLDQTIAAAFRYKSYGVDRVFLGKLAALAGTPIFDAHIKSLRLETYTATLSPLPFTDGALIDLIKQFPRLFSSFYAVPAPGLKHIHIPALIAFYHALIENLLKATLSLFNLMEIKPVALFIAWMRWRTDTHPEAPVSGEFVVPTFPDFLRWLLPRPHSQISSLPSKLSCA